MTWYDPSTLASHTAASEAWAVITHSTWKAGWIDEEGEIHRLQKIIKPGSSLSDGLLQQVTTLIDQGFPQDGKLYIASTDCVIAPNTYAHQATTLLHTVLDETIPANTVRLLELDYISDASLYYVCAPALAIVWGKVVSQGKIIPLTERDLHYIMTVHKEADAVLVHVLPGYVQLTIKQDHKLQLCNSFRYQEGEEARLMSRAVIDQCFPHGMPAVQVMYTGDAEADIANKLIAGMQGATIVTPDQRYWV